MGKIYLCDEVGIRHEELFSYVKNGKNGSQLVFKSQFGGFGSSWGFLSVSTVDLGVNAGGAGLRLC